MKKTHIETSRIVEAAVEGIRRLKGKKIAVINLTTIHHTECEFFIICHGTSNTPAESIARSVEETVKEMTGLKTWHKDGYRNAIWILLDYGEVMVHIFQKEARDFYNLEGLWADAKVTDIEEN